MARCASTSSSVARSRSSRSSSSRPRPPRARRTCSRPSTSCRGSIPPTSRVTYGAGGSTRDKTLEIVTRIRAEFGLEAMAHFTCVNATVDELRAELDRFRDAGRRERARAARRPARRARTEWTKTDGGFEHSRELVELINAEYPLHGRAAPASPRPTSTPPRPEDDLRHLRDKVDAGVASSSPSCSSTTPTTSTSSPAPARSASRSRSCRASCRSPTFNQIKRVTSCAARRSPTSLTALLERRAERRGGGRVRRGLRHAAVRRAAGPRRARHPLLHAQPLPGDARDPQRAAPLAPVGPRHTALGEPAACRRPPSAARCPASRPAPANRRGAGSARRRCRPGDRCPRPRRPGTSASR